MQDSQFDIFTQIASFCDSNGDKSWLTNIVDEGNEAAASWVVDKAWDKVEGWLETAPDDALKSMVGELCNKYEAYDERKTQEWKSWSTFKAG